MSVEIRPLEGIPEVRPGDDLAELLATALRDLNPHDADVLAVTQKIVSKAEGRVVPEAEHAAAVQRETVRIVARRDDLVISETAHGFVCANAGVDISNVAGQMVTLLPGDPDGSAERLRSQLQGWLGVALSVVITDTFGRPWRNGVVNVAIGCAGLPSAIDLRGSTDHHGRTLDATIVALADEVSAAAGLVMTKAARIPAALVRGVDTTGAPPSPASVLVRPSDEDLFRESPLQALQASATAIQLGDGPVPRKVLEEAIRIAYASPSPVDHSSPRFTVVTSDGGRQILARVAGDPSLAAVSTVVVPCIPRQHADDHLVAAGSTIRTLQLALRAQSIASSFNSVASSTLTSIGEALGVQEGWLPLGLLACAPQPRETGWVNPPTIDLDDVVTFR